jgi:hypothetical protein
MTMLVDYEILYYIILKNIKKLKKATKILSKHYICYTGADTCINIPTTPERTLLTATYYSGTLLHP